MVFYYFSSFFAREICWYSVPVCHKGTATKPQARSQTQTPQERAISHWAGRKVGPDMWTRRSAMIGRRPSNEEQPPSLVPAAIHAGPAL